MSRITTWKGSESGKSLDIAQFTSITEMHLIGHSDISIAEKTGLTIAEVVDITSSIERDGQFREQVKTINAMPDFQRYEKDIEAQFKFLSAESLSGLFSSSQDIDRLYDEYLKDPSKENKEKYLIATKHNDVRKENYTFFRNANRSNEKAKNNRAKKALKIVGSKSAFANREIGTSETQADDSEKTKRLLNMLSDD